MSSVGRLRALLERYLELRRRLILEERRVPPTVESANRMVAKSLARAVAGDVDNAVSGLETAISLLEKSYSREVTG